MKIRRRTLLAGAAACALLAATPAKAFFPRGATPSISNNAWMETPDILAFTVSDAPGKWGNIYDTGSVIAAPYDVWTTASNPRDGGAVENAMPIGIPRQYYKFNDLFSTAFVNRLALRVATNYTINNGLSISKVWFRQEENSQLGYVAGVGNGLGITQTVTIYLKLSAAPTNNVTYTIRNNTAGIAPIVFHYSDKTVRAGAIRTSAGGHKPNDPFKMAYLACRIPGNPAYGDPGTHGSIDVAGTYGITSWQIVDSTGTTVFTGGVPALRCAVGDLELPAYFTGFIDDGSAYPSPSGVAGNVLSVTAITDGYVNSSTSFNLVGAGVPSGTQITASNNTHGHGGAGGVGQYTVSGAAQTIGSEQMGQTDAYLVGIDVADTSQSWTITSVTKGNPTTIGFAGGHGFSTGDKARFRGISGMTQLEGSPGTAKGWTAQTVTVVDPNTITIPVDSTAYGSLTTGTYDAAIGGYENQAYKCFNTNRAGATVYGLDYSAFAPASADNYYIYVPGWGISDPIPISQIQFANNAALQHKGIYNLRLGIALDGRAGYTRGVALLDGSGGLENFWSNLPAPFSTECGTFSATSNQQIESGIGAYTTSVVFGSTTWVPWGTTNRATGSRSGHQDAGDNDDLTIDHAPAWATLAFVFEAIQNKLSAASCATPFVVPLSSVVCDPTLFAGTDSAAPLWHEMVWWAESLRTMQNTNPADTVLYGSIPGGYGIGHFSQQTPDAPEPISYYHGTDPNNVTDGGIVGAFLYAPDHLSGIYVTQFFAKLAIISYAYGFGAVGDAYKSAATLLYNWCQGIATNTTTRDNYYQTHLGLLTNYTAQFGWTTTEYNAAMAKMLTTYNNALPGVQATLWRLSGINSSGVYPAAGAPTPDWTDYGSPADTSFSSLVGTQGGWDYVQCSAYPNYNAAHGSYISTGHWTDSFTKGAAQNTVTRKTSFATNQWNNLGGVYPYTGNLLTHMMQVNNGASPATSISLSAMLANFSFQYGANLRGRGYTIGQGLRSTVLADHNDSIRLAENSPIGLTPFTFSTTGWGTYSLGTFFNMTVGANCDSTSVCIATNTSGTNEANFGSKKVIEPWPQAQAAWEWAPQNNFLILISEYTLGSLLLTLSTALWCHGWDASHI